MMRGSERAWAFPLAFIVLALAPAADARAEGAFTFGLETDWVLDRPMKLPVAPGLSRVTHDYLAGTQTQENMEYFEEISQDGVIKSSFTRSWDTISYQTRTAYLKFGYSSVSFDMVINVGIASVSNTFIENAKVLHMTGAAQSEERSAIPIELDVPVGPAYGFEIKFLPYQRENFDILVDFQMSRQTTDGYLEDMTSVTSSTSGAVTSYQRQTEYMSIDNVSWGLSFISSYKFGRFVPYFGFGYSDARFHAKIRTITENRNYTAAGVPTVSTKEIETIAYSLKPQDKMHVMLGFRVPFEQGGLSFEMRLGPEKSVKLSAMVGF